MNKLIAFMQMELIMQNNVDKPF